MQSAASRNVIRLRSGKTIGLQLVQPLQARTMTLERPMFPLSRRGFLTLAGGSAATLAAIPITRAVAATAESPDASKAAQA
jgi:hypothetical protein